MGFVATVLVIKEEREGDRVQEVVPPDLTIQCSAEVRAAGVYVSAGDR
jgi:hypothetical protein